MQSLAHSERLEIKRLVKETNEEKDRLRTKRFSDRRKGTREGRVPGRNIFLILIFINRGIMVMIVLFRNTIFDRR